MSTMGIPPGHHVVIMEAIPLCHSAMTVSWGPWKVVPFHLVYKQTCRVGSGGSRGAQQAPPIDRHR